MPDPFPRRDDQLLPFIGNLSRQISADPARYSLSSEQADTLAALYAAFEQAFRISSAPATRTRSSIIAKDAARQAAVDFARTLANIARVAAGMTDATLAPLGLKLPKKTRTRIPAPATAPSLCVRRVACSRITLRLIDPASPTRRAKPRGVASAVVFMSASEFPPASSSDWQMIKHAAVTTLEISLGMIYPPGTKVWFCAQWSNSTGQRGPCSSPISTWTGYGEMSLANPLLRAA